MDQQQNNKLQQPLLDSLGFLILAGCRLLNLVQSGYKYYFSFPGLGQNLDNKLQQHNIIIDQVKIEKGKVS